MERIKSISRVMGWLLKLGIYLTALGFIISAILIILAPNSGNFSIGQFKIPVNQLTAGTKIILIISASLIYAVFLYALVNLKKLFALYEQGRVFDEANVKYMKAFSYSIIMYAFLKSIILVFISIVIAISTSGQNSLNISLFEELPTLIIGIIFLIISMIMDEARKLKQEQDLTI